MFQYPVALQPVSNREDFLLTLQVWDDDLSQLVNLTGCTTANNLPFTGSAWTVTDGSITTTSATTLNITFSSPQGANNPSNTAPNPALTLTVGTNLGILPGDQVQIVDTPTGLNGMIGTVVNYTKATGVLICQIGWSFQFEIRRPDFNQAGTGGYIDFWDWGTPNDASPLFALALGSGISYLQGGYVQVLILETQFRTTLNGSPMAGNDTYLVGMTGSDGYSTRQIFVGTLPVIYGSVTN
jgi:hypothetical protein